MDSLSINVAVYDCQCNETTNHPINRSAQHTSSIGLKLQCCGNSWRSITVVPETQCRMWILLECLTIPCICWRHDRPNSVELVRHKKHILENRQRSDTVYCSTRWKTYQPARNDPLFGTGTFRIHTKLVVIFVTRVS